MKKRIPLISIFILLLFISCGCTYPTNPESPEEASVNCSVAWRIDIESSSIPPMELRSDIIYLGEDRSNGAAAINASDGTLVWRDENREEFDSLPYFFENVTIGFSTADRDNFKLVLYDPADGSYNKTICCPGKEYYNQDSSGTVYGNKIYWSANQIGLVCLDIENDIIWDSHYNCWIGTPTTLHAWPVDGNDDGIRSVRPLINNGVLYSGYNEEISMQGVYFAYDLNSSTLIWKKNIGELTGSNEWPPLLIYGKLILIERGLAIINPADGAIEKLVGYHTLKPRLTFYSTTHIYNDKIYFTNSSATIGTLECNNVFAVDANTGDTVWEDSFRSSLGSNPICYNGITYIAAQSSIELYNAETGEYLGSDDSLWGDSWQISNTLQYGDLMIFKDEDELIAIKMDYKIDRKGELVKEGKGLLSFLN